MQPAEPGSAPHRGRSDLDTPTAIHDLVVGFYREVVFDDLLEPVFGEVAEVDWAEHIPKLIEYWCQVLLHRPGRGGSVLAVHRHLHGLEPLRREHCDRWFALWVRSVDAGWAGPVADTAKRHAGRIMASIAARVIGIEWAPPGEPRSEPGFAGSTRDSTADPVPDSTGVGRG